MMTIFPKVANLQGFKDPEGWTVPQKKTKNTFSQKKIGLGSLKILHLPHQFTQWGAFLVNNQGNYRLRSHPPNLIRVMPAKGWRKGITCLIGYLLTI